MPKHKIGITYDREYVWDVTVCRGWYPIKITVERGEFVARPKASVEADYERMRKEYERDKGHDIF